jgi:hypothetical protein
MIHIIADNLAWKMSDVLKGIAANPEQLLDSYSFEVYKKKDAFFFSFHFIQLTQNI